MDIVFHSHHADVSDALRERAARTVRKLATRLSRVTGAVVRFEEDGPSRRVEIELHAYGRKLVAAAAGRYFGPALGSASQRLLARVQHERRDKGRRHTMRSRRRAAPTA